MTLPLGDMLFHMYLSDRVDWQTCHQFGEHERIEPRQRMGPLAHGHKNKKSWGFIDFPKVLRRQIGLFGSLLIDLLIIIFTQSHCQHLSRNQSQGQSERGDFMPRVIKWKLHGKVCFTLDKIRQEKGKIVS